MSKEKSICLKKENLKEKPEKCSPEQIKKCHGEERVHSCVEAKKTELKETAKE